MAFPWLPPLGLAQSQKSSPATQTIGSKTPGQETLVITGVARWVESPSRYLSVENAVAVYGQSRLRADHLRLYPDASIPPVGGAAVIPAGSGFADGHVILDDPIGSLSAETLNFNWLLHTGSAIKARFSFQHVVADADSIQLTPTEWTVNSVTFRSSDIRPIAKYHAKTIVIRPGKQAVAYRSEFILFGRTILKVKRQGFQLDKRVFGLRYPTLSITNGTKIGVNFDSSMLLNEQSAVVGSFAGSPGNLPSYGLQFARSYVAPGEINGLIAPSSDLDERFTFGYFDNLNVREPEAEYAQISAARNTVSAGSFWNISTVDRLKVETLSKPIELSWERSQKIGSFAALSNFSFQNIRQERGEEESRLSARTSMSLPVWKLSRHVSALVRVDASAIQGNDNTFSWVHGEGGLIFQPNSTIRLALSSVVGKQFGIPVFIADELYSSHGITGRFDLRVGPRRFSLLSKYDLGQHNIYDTEFYFSQIAGSFEPFLLVRSFPSQVIIGFQLRFDSVLRSLQSRNPERPATTK